MDREGGPSYYRILGVDRGASVAEIRGAYRKLALVRFLFLPAVPKLTELDYFPFPCLPLVSSRFRAFCLWFVKKWHPDRWTRDPAVAGEAKRQFQQIQEAYAGKRERLI